VPLLLALLLLALLLLALLVLLLLATEPPDPAWAPPVPAEEEAEEEADAEFVSPDEHPVSADATRAAAIERASIEIFMRIKLRPHWGRAQRNSRST
jgi:hypothetical protein